MENRENIFDKRLRQLGIKKQVDAAMVVKAAELRIRKVFGERGIESLRVVSFNKGVLKIAAKSSAWAAECQGNAAKIIEPPVERLVFVSKVEDVNL